ncbi:MAG: hypothetical protein IPN85_01190 [Flavobacteriales bacterium]|nr:hypothetical protein [Flavobacteriales bacterium]
MTGPIAVDQLTLTSTERAVVRALLYFDIFRHPLREDELRRFLSTECPDEHCVEVAINTLAEEGLLHRVGEHFMLNGSSASVTERLEAEERARRRMAKARSMSQLMSHFPFVRGILLSGSMSKGVLAEDGDIDYFVITQPGRLWVARTLLIAFKKVFLFNSRRDFCVNYFVDTEHLVIEDKNLFTATEVMTLVPMAGRTVCGAFFAANTWAGTHLPNAETPCLEQVPVPKRRMQRLFERLLGGGMGDELDEWCMLRTKERWRRKFPEFDGTRFELALRSRRYVSKHHPRNFQERVLTAFAQGLRAFEQRTGHAVS